MMTMSLTQVWVVIDKNGVLNLARIGEEVKSKIYFKISLSNVLKMMKMSIEFKYIWVHLIWCGWCWGGGRRAGKLVGGRRGVRQHWVLC
jgi:hypothetical protein